jgi:hypothetical protein
MREHGQVPETLRFFYPFSDNVAMHNIGHVALQISRFRARVPLAVLMSKRTV